MPKAALHHKFALGPYVGLRLAMLGACLALLGLSNAWARPLFAPEDAVAEQAAEPARKPSNPVDTAGAGGHNELATRTLRELQVGRPGGITFSSSHSMSESGARGGFKGAADTSIRASEQAGLFGSGLNADATQRQNMDQLPMEAVTPTGVHRLPKPETEEDTQERDVASDNTYAIGTGRGQDLESSPSLVSRLFKLVREYRLAVIGACAFSLVLIGALALFARRPRYS